MEIKNVPKMYNDDETKALRAAVEHRAAWMYLLMDEARQNGLSWDDFARKAISKCGSYHGKTRIKENCPDYQDLTKFLKPFISDETMKVLEVEVLKAEQEELELEFHYCPLVAAWQKLGCSQEDIRHLCDIAMDGDRGIAGECGLEITIHTKIAEGADSCRISFKSGK